MNRFEQVSSDGHQMSPVGRGAEPGGSRVWRGARARGVPGPMGWRVLYSEVQSIMGNGHMGTPHPHRHNDGQTRLKTLPSSNFVGAR